MTLAKMCHASNIMQVLEKATYRPIATTKAFCSAQHSIVASKKIESDLET